MSNAVPPWLEPLLTTKFFTACAYHSDSPRNECNMFCVDCAATQRPVGFCFYCRSQFHLDHHVIQIRRSSYHDVVRAADLQKVLDIGGVQTYIINSARVLFLNERPQPRGNGKVAGSPHVCMVCSRTLLDPFRFCSLGCKLAEIKRAEEEAFVKGEGEGEGSCGGGVTGAVGEKSETEDDVRTPTTARISSRRRKGVPHRAPLK